MTDVPSHCIGLAYHNKAMDLNSWAINVNEELLATSEEGRARLVETQHKFLADVDTALKRHSHLSFGRAAIRLYQGVPGSPAAAAGPVGQALFFPLKIRGDDLACTLLTADTEPLDHRRVIPSMERIQGRLDEVRRVALVRGINFVQQEAILQRYANRFLQLAEADYAEERWNASKHASTQPSTTVTVDLPPAPERPEWMRVATYRMPWRVDTKTGDFVPSVDDASQEIETLSALDDEYLIQFNIVCPALPIVPRLLETVVSRLNKLWVDILPAFVPGWKHDLVQALVGKAMAEVDAASYSILTPPCTIERELLEKTSEHVKGFDEYASGLEARFRDLKSQPTDANIFNAMLEGFKTTVGKSPAIELLAGAIKAAHAASLSSTIVPGMDADSSVAEGTLLQVKRGIAGIQPALVQAIVGEIARSIVVRAAARLDERLLKDVLQNEKGIVKEIGTSVLKAASQAFLQRQVERLDDPGAAGIPIVDPLTFKGDYKAAVQSCLAGFKIDIGQLIQLAAELLDEAQRDVIAPYLQKFLALKRDVVFLKEFLLKADVLNKFLEKHYEHFYDPKSFGKLLGDWVSGEVTQLPVEWGSLLGNWFAAFTNVFQIQHAQKPLTRSEIMQKFYEFTRIVADEQNTFDNTFAIMSSFAGTLTDSKDKKALTEYLKRFEQSQAFQGKFPSYLEGKIANALDEVEAGDLDVKMEDPAALSAAIVRRVEAGIPGMPRGCVAVPSEIVLHFDLDRKIEFKLALDAAPDGLTVELLTNWFKLVDAY
ncbi:MAG: hypothetical protein JW839_10130 [Candidatus Lokiarchaeota archaeon]|nr:hypothetical protein [Candidatus Lokiarchaeota archaeon]